MTVVPGVPRVPEASESSLRAGIAEALDGWMSAEQLRELLGEILASKKQARGWCPKCKKAVLVEIPDAKAVTAGLESLANQGFGRPSESAKGSGGIVFERVVYMGMTDEAGAG